VHHTAKQKFCSETQEIWRERKNKLTSILGRKKKRYFRLRGRKEEEGSIILNGERNTSSPGLPSEGGQKKGGIGKKPPIAYYKQGGATAYQFKHGTKEDLKTLKRKVKWSRKRTQIILGPRVSGEKYTINRMATRGNAT